jgi:hypothetical protein
MNIIEAAKCMQTGKEIHRVSWGESPVKLHVCDPFSKIHDDLDRISSFSIVELLAEDWEVTK